MYTLLQKLFKQRKMWMNKGSATCTIATRFPDILHPWFHHGPVQVRMLTAVLCPWSDGPTMVSSMLPHPPNPPCSDRGPIDSLYAPCSHHAPNMLPPCSHHTPTMLPPCSHHALIMLPPCSHHALTILSPCSHHAPAPCSHHAPTMLPPCSHHAPTMLPPYSHHAPTMLSHHASAPCSNHAPTMLPHHVPAPCSHHALTMHGCPLWSPPCVWNAHCSCIPHCISSRLFIPLAPVVPSSISGSCCGCCLCSISGMVSCASKHLPS